MTDGERFSNELTHDWWRKVFKWTDPWLMEKEEMYFYFNNIGLFTSIVLIYWLVGV